MKVKITLEGIVNFKKAGFLKKANNYGKIIKGWAYAFANTIKASYGVEFKVKSIRRVK